MLVLRCCECVWSWEWVDNNMVKACDMAYVLLGKVKTDNLESRFGNYAQVFGSNYLISVKEVLQSEKMLKLINYIYIIGL